MRRRIVRSILALSFVTLASCSSSSKPNNGGGQWTPIVFNGGQVTPIAIDPTNPSTIYVGTGVILKSTNGGATFTVTDRSLFGNVSSIAIDPANPSTVYAGLAFFSGLFKTTDGGGRWSNINDGLAASYASKKSTSGGFKTSGVGSRHGDAGMLKYTDVQNVAVLKKQVLSNPPDTDWTKQVQVTIKSMRLMRKLGIR